MITIRSVLLTTKIISDKICSENQKAHFMFHIFSPENRAVYETMWKNMVERGRSQLTVMYNTAQAHCMLDN